MLFLRFLSSRKLVRLPVACALFLLWTGLASAGDPFSFSGNWNYRENGGGESGSRQFFESYNLVYRKDLSSGMGFSGSVRYSENDYSEGADSEVISPTLSFDLRNDLFAINLNASETQTKQVDSPTRSSDTWGLNINSSIENLPKFRVYFSQNSSSDNAVPKQSDNESTSFGGSIDYAFEYVELLYDVRATQSINNLSGSENESLDQSAQIAYQQTLWPERWTVSASQQYQLTTSEQQRFVGAGNVVPVPLLTFNRFYAIDNDPVNADLGTATFQGVDILSTSSSQNMTLQVNGQSYDLLEVLLYRNVTPIDKGFLSAAQINQLNEPDAWTVYYRDLLSAPWQAVPAGGVVRVIENRNVQQTDGSLAERTVVKLSLPNVLSSTYVKVVADVNAYFDPALVDDVVANETVISARDIFTASRETTTLQTQLNTTFRMTDNWTLSYSLRRAETQLEDGDTVQFNQSLNNSYNPSEKLSFSLGINQNIDQQLNSGENRNQSYSFAMSLLPIQALRISVGYTRSETQSDNGLDTVSNSVTSSLNASIYPDLSANLTTYWSNSETSREDDSNESYGASFNTTAYLTPRLDLNTRLNYAVSQSSGGVDTTKSNYGVSLGLRPSDILLMNVTVNGDFEGESTTIGATSSVLWTRKLQSQFGLTYDLGEEQSQQYTTHLSWGVNKNMSLKANANYAVSDELNSWSYNVNANMFF